MKNKELDLEEVKNLLLNQHFKIKDAAEKLGCTIIKLQRFMRKNDIKIAKRYPQELKDKVLEILDTGLYKHQEIADKVGLTLTEVRSIIKQRQAKKRESQKYSNKIGLDLFNNNNKQLLWYLIGLITTDGHIDSRSKTVCVFQKDIPFLKHLQLLLKHNGKVYTSTSKDGEEKCYAIHILDEKLHNFLVDNDFETDKRYNVKFLDCPKEFLSDYIRGLFDGDGCLSYKYISGRFEGCILQFTSGSKLLAEKLQSVLKEIGFDFNIQNKISVTGNPYYDIKLCIMKEVVRFCKYMYNNSLEYKLKRKYILFLKLCKLIEFTKQLNEIVEPLEKYNGIN